MNPWQQTYEERMKDIEETLKAFIDRQKKRCAHIETDVSLLLKGNLNKQVSNIIDEYIIPKIHDALSKTELAKETKEVIETILINAKISLTQLQVQLNERMDKIEQSFLDFMYSINHGGVIIQLPIVK